MGCEPVVVLWSPLRLARVRCERVSVVVVCPPVLPSSVELIPETSPGDTAKAVCCSSTAVVPARLIRVSTGRCGLGLPPAQPGGCGPPEAAGVV